MHESGLDHDHRPVHQTEVQLSQEYKAEKETCIQHSAYMPHGKHKWKLKVKGRRRNSKNWFDINKIYKNATVELKHNDVYLHLESPGDDALGDDAPGDDTPGDDVVVAVFGVPGDADIKRMQMAAFSKRTSTGKAVRVTVYLLDDTVPSFQGTCSREKANGNQLLSPMSSVFLSAVNTDVKLTLSKLSKGWKHDGQDTKTLKFSKVWNSQNSAVPPHCSFVLKQTDVDQKSWACHVSLQHHTETARVETSGNIKEEPKEAVRKSYNRRLSTRGKVHLAKTQSTECSRRGYTGLLLAACLIFLGLAVKGSHFPRNERIVLSELCVLKLNRTPRFIKGIDGRSPEKGRKHSLKQKRNKNNFVDRGFSDTQNEGKSEDNNCAFLAET